MSCLLILLTVICSLTETLVVPTSFKTGSVTLDNQLCEVIISYKGDTGLWSPIKSFTSNTSFITAKTWYSFDLPSADMKNTKI